MSVRLPPDLRAIIAALAPEFGGKPHAAVIHLIRRGAEGITLPAPPAEPKEVLALAEAKAAHLGTKKRSRRSWSLKGVHLGPVDPPLGSRLKGATPGKAKR